MGNKAQMEYGGVNGLILYVAVIAVIAIVSLAVLLNFFLFMPPPNSKLHVYYYLDGKEIRAIHCTIIDSRGYAYYDSYNNSPILSILVMKNGLPQKNVWVTISGCGITSESGETDMHGYAHLNIRSIYLPPDIKSDRLSVSVLGDTFYIQVLRG